MRVLYRKPDIYEKFEAAIAKALDAAKVNATKNSSCTITQLGASDLNGL